PRPRRARDDRAKRRCKDDCHCADRRRRDSGPHQIGGAIRPSRRRPGRRGDARAGRRARVKPGLATADPGMPTARIDIAGRTIGRGNPPLIIAEMSGNHNGRLERALDIVRAAAEAGAHAIKLQTFTASTLTVDSRRPEFFIDDPGGAWHGRRLWELYEEAHTPWEWHGPIFAAARAAGLACVSTAFDRESMQFLLSLDVDAIKIASFELVHLPLLEIAGRSGKPVLLSTGMATLAELDESVATLRAAGCEQLILLKCTSAYPSTEGDANLITLDD